MRKFYEMFSGSEGVKDILDKIYFCSFGDGFVKYFNFEVFKSCVECY